MRKFIFFHLCKWILFQSRKITHQSKVIHTQYVIHCFCVLKWKFTSLLNASKWFATCCSLFSFIQKLLGFLFYLIGLRSVYSLIHLGNGMKCLDSKSDELSKLATLIILRYLTLKLKLFAVVENDSILGLTKCWVSFL